MASYCGVNVSDKSVDDMSIDEGANAINPFTQVDLAMAGE
jgi:hypothetical protein